ncbi:MAG TPA: hypothetical protein VFN67_13160, partial [Polyangiales bacterium]|nr:hypothetical protein [Polyangiales bacterium]
AYSHERAAALAFAETVALAVRVRDALFAARTNGKLASPLFLRAMEICATAFLLYKPLTETGFAGRSAAAVRAATQPGIAVTRLRAIKEELGLIAWLYETSALLGVDLSTTVAANAVDLGSRCVESRPIGGGRLQYFESGTAYSVNVMVCVDVPGSPLPLVIAGEAKGGASGYGEVVTPRDMAKVLFIQPPVKQNTLDYARTRALYMKREQGTSPAQRARREAGMLIDGAGTRETLVFVAARGDVRGMAQTTLREHLECQ